MPDRPENGLEKPTLFPGGANGSAAAFTAYGTAAPSPADAWSPHFSRAECIDLPGAAHTSSGVIRMQLTRKETELLKDLKEQEKLCAEKYTKHASCAKDSQLKDLFTQIAQVEQGHLDTLTQMENGGETSPKAGSQPQPAPQETYSASDSADKQADSYLCTDLLASEKHTSHGYDVSVFEFRDETARNALNHIQKEEQEHGKMIYDYMEKNHMYS